MKILSNTSWKRQGSCILFGLTEIQELLNEKSMVSLKEFLSWRNNVPDDPPIPEDADTILVCGLETVMDTLSAEDAQEFLQYQVRPVIKNIQDIWTNTGVAFGFPQGSMSFKETNGSIPAQRQPGSAYFRGIVGWNRRIKYAKAGDHIHLR